MKRILSALMAVIMICSLFPAYAINFEWHKVESVEETVQDFSYCVNGGMYSDEYETEQDTQLINVKVGVYDYTATDLKIEGASESGVVLENVSVSVPVGASAIDAVKKAFSDNGVEAEFDGNYLKKVNGFGEGKGYAGWCLSYNNDDFSNWGPEYITLSEGDVLEYHYSCNFDTTTDDIGNGWYGLPIITELEIAGVKKTFSKKTSYDESYNAVTTYYEGDKEIVGKGTQEEPFEINVVVPYGTDKTKLKANVKTSLNEHYGVFSKDLLSENDYTDALEFTLSTKGGKFVSFYKISVSVSDEITIKVGVYDYTATDLKIEGASESGVVLENVSVSVPVGASAIDAVKKAFSDNGVEAEFDGNYLKKVNGFGEGKGYAGWCLSYNNDDFSNWGPEYITLSEGDVLEYHYSCNFDTTTDDIGNGWYGLPIITELEIAGVKKTFSKKTSYDESYNAVTTYYEGDKEIVGKGTQEEPFEINVVVPYGTDKTKLKANVKTSLNEHYGVFSKDLLSENDYTDALEFTLSTKGGKFVSFYKISVSVSDEITIKVGVYDYTATDLKIEGASESGVVLENVSVSVPVGASAIDAVKKAFSDNGVEAEFDGNYLKKVNGFGEGKGYAGWCLSYNNDDFSNWGPEYITLSEGDVLEYHYSCNFDTTTDDIGNGWYGLPIITELEIAGVKKTFSKKTSYDESYNAVTTYYEGDKEIVGKGTQEEPFEINVVVPYGTDKTKLKANVKTSLNEHYGVFSKDLLSENDYTDALEFTLSTKGGKFVSFYKISVSVTPGGGGNAGNNKDEEDDKEDEEESEEIKCELDEEKVFDKLSDITDYIQKTVTNPSVSSTGGEWSVIGLAKSGKLSETLKSKYLTNLKKELNKNGGVLGTKYSEYARVCLSLLAIETDDEELFFEIAKKLYNTSHVTVQGSTSSAFAYIVMSHIENDTRADNAKKIYLSHMLSCQNADGGFALVKGGLSDVDVTSMILCAFASVSGNKNVKESAEKAFNFLSGVQTANASFKNSGVENSESVSQVILALSAHGISLTDERFVKNGRTAFDALCDFEKNGAFSHAKGEKASLMATEQALCALTALTLFLDGDNGFYEFEIIEKTDNESVPPVVTPEKDDNIKDREEEDAVTDEENKQQTSKEQQDKEQFSIHFDDMTQEKYKDSYEKVRVLCEMGIVNGMGNGKFAPETEMTRAQLTAVLVRSIGDKISVSETSGVFSDVDKNAWYANVVNTAYALGIVNGMSESIFAPENKVTLEQTAVIIVRTLSKLGVDTTLSEEAVRNSLSQFSDYKSVSDYAKDALAFCYISGILSEEAMKIEPRKNVVRIDMVEMVYNAVMLVKN